MKLKILTGCCILVVSLVVLFLSPALADKAAVKIEAPASTAKGSEITIRVTVTHNGNSERHHVEWLKVWINNQEVEKWEYSSSKLPEGVPFTREVKYKAGSNLEIKAEASCNIHGGKGPVTVKVTVK